MSYLADVGARRPGPAARAALAGHRAGDAALRRLHLVVFNFALPAGASADAAYGLLWAALVFTAILGVTRAFAAENEQRVLDGLVLAPSDRSAIWLGKVIAVVAFLALAEIVALPAFALFFQPVSWELVAGVALASVGFAAVRTLLAAMAAASRARELLLPSLPAARDPDRRRWRRRLDRRRSRPLPRLPRLYDLILRSCPGRARYVVAEQPRGRLAAANRGPPPRDLASVLLGARRADRGLPAADLLHPRPHRADRIRLLLLGGVEGLRLLLDARTALRPGELHGRAHGRHLRDPHARHRLDLGADLLGSVVDVERAPARALPRPVLFCSAYFMLRFSVDPGHGGQTCPPCTHSSASFSSRVSFLFHPAGRRAHPPGRLHQGRQLRPRRGQLLTFGICFAGMLA